MGTLIEPTPVLEAEDAERLMEQLENVCSPDEAARRIASARQLLATVLVNGDERAAVE